MLSCITRFVSAVVWPMWHWICFRSMLLGQEGEGSRNGVAVLGLEAGPIDGAGVEPRRSAGLEARPLQAQSPELVAQKLGRSFAIAAAAVLLLADVGQAVQEGAGRDDHGAGRQESGHLGV